MENDKVFIIKGWLGINLFPGMDFESESEAEDFMLDMFPNRPFEELPEYEIVEKTVVFPPDDML